MSSELERRIRRVEQATSAEPDSCAELRDNYAALLEELGVSRAEILAHLPDGDAAVQAATLFRAIINWLAAPDTWDNLPRKEAPNDR